MTEIFTCREYGILAKYWQAGQNPSLSPEDSLLGSCRGHYFVTINHHSTSVHTYCFESKHFIQDLFFLKGLIILCITALQPWSSLWGFEVRFLVLFSYKPFV